METLVIKNNLLSGGAEKLYGDVIVSKGTIFCFDFSNRGCVNNDDLSTVKDLARKAKDDLGIPDDVSFQVTDRGTIPALTAQKGYPIVDLGSYSATSYDSGLNIYGIDEYLYEKQPEKLIATFWVGHSGGDNSTNVTWVKAGFSDNLRLSGGVSGTSLYMTNSGFVNEPITNVLQLTVERQGLGTPNRMYINGRFVGEQSSSNLSTMFGLNEEGNPLSIGVKTTVTSSNLVLYRAFMEDLSVSGRSAIDVIRKDYNYVNAQGEFLGIERRPYANLPAA